jgi:hypothetical protein
MSALAMNEAIFSKLEQRRLVHALGPLPAAPTKGPRASALLLPTPAGIFLPNHPHATNGPIAFYAMALANLRRINR